MIFFLVIGHKGEIVYGKLAGKWVICFNGRYHSYEHDMDLALVKTTSF
jgi:hypothetical protein